MKNNKDVKILTKVDEIIAIKKLIEQESKNNFKMYYSDKNIQEVRDILRKFNDSTKEEFTFTVGDVNAYLG
ncbi:MAG TPA: hypothetical protein P5268_05145 [Candidatus Marinimicrobia bacterium]|nr:hypothetical protein [Candidatus Neomarinimicrobiota bacterium]HRU92401.1 hypothetical protein [Candidatus Neomarinimicrobiota bacterium]